MTHAHNPKYFDLLFRCPLKQEPIDSSQKFWVFEHLFSSGFDALPQAVYQDLSSIALLGLEPEACQDLAGSLQKRLKGVLGPALQANYLGLVKRAEKDGLIPKKRNKAQETEVQQWFLKTMGHEGTTRFFRTNVYLKKTAQKIIDDWSRSNKIFLERLVRDADKLYQQEKLSAKRSGTTSKQGKLVVQTLQCDLSDPHQNGESVRIVTLANGSKFVYKPRSLAPENNFYQLIEHINNLNALTQLYIPWIIGNKQYGWMEYCQSLSEITPNLSTTPYARQFGTLCVLWYLLGGTDLHHENILFTDKGVVVIDCETIFEADFACSALTTSVIPSVEPAAITHTILDTLALTAVLSDLDPDEETIHNIGGVDDFKSLLKSSTKNKYGRWKNFTNATYRAIETTFQHFQNQPIDDVIHLIKKYFARQTPTRVVLRPTNSYGALLYNLSINFEVLQEPAATRKYIEEQLKKIPLPYMDSLDPESVRKTEVEQLARFDIPYFIRDLGKQRIYSSGGFEAQLNQMTDFSSLEYRLAWLQNPHFIEDEVYLAKLALTPLPILKGYTKKGSDTHDYIEYHRNTKSFYAYTPFKTERAIFNLLSSIGTQLQAELSSHDRAEHAFYITQHRKNKEVHQPVPMSYSLFSGWAGKLLFLGAYARVTSQPTLVRLVRQRLEYFIKLGQHPEYIPTNRSGGLGAGYQSLVYVFECLKKIQVIDEYPSNFALNALRPDTDQSYDYDFVSATSGNALLAALLKNKLPDTVLHEWGGHLKQSMQNLLAGWDTKKDKKRIGLAHGALGPCLAASRLCQAGIKDTELRSLALTLAEKEAELMQEERGAKDFIESTSGWCYGMAGRALTYHNMGKAFDASEFIEKARDLTVLKSSNFQFPNHTLCCGSLGYLAAHLTINKDQPGYSDKAFRLKLLSEFYADPHRLLMSQYRKDQCMMPTGLFYGLSGMGMVLLYYLEPDIVPAVWNVE